MKCQKCEAKLHKPLDSRQRNQLECGGGQQGGGRGNGASTKKVKHENFPVFFVVFFNAAEFINISLGANEKKKQDEGKKMQVPVAAKLWRTACS